MSEQYEKQTWFDDDIFLWLQQEALGSVFNWPNGVTVESKQTKPYDKYERWGESHTVIKVDGETAVEMNMGGKHGDSIESFTLTNKGLLGEIFKRMIDEQQGATNDRQ